MSVADTLNNLAFLVYSFGRPRHVDPTVAIDAVISPRKWNVVAVDSSKVAQAPILAPTIDGQVFAITGNVGTVAFKLRPPVDGVRHFFVTGTLVSASFTGLGVSVKVPTLPGAGLYRLRFQYDAVSKPSTPIWRAVRVRG